MTQTRGQLYLMTIRSTAREDGGLRVEGIANRGDTTDTFGTRFNWTAKCAQESRGGIVLFNHDPSNPIGRNREMEVRSGNLWVRDMIDGNAVTPHQRSIPDLVEKGILDGLSVRFDQEAVSRRKPGQDFVTITPNRVVEHSIVSLPSNHESTMSPMLRGLLNGLERSEEGQEIAALLRMGWAASGGEMKKLGSSYGGKYAPARGISKSDILARVRGRSARQISSADILSRMERDRMREAFHRAIFRRALELDRPRARR